MAKLKVLILAVGLPVFLLLMLGLGLFFKNHNSKTVAGPAIISPTPFNTQALVANSGPMALITRESGIVTYKLPGSSDFQPLTGDEANVPSGTAVKTAADSFAHVVFPDNSLMSLSKDTEVVVNFEDKKIKISQLLGNTWHRVEKVLQGNSYEVETPNTLATVRGTEFNVGILPNNESEVYVMESIVDVSKLKKKDGQMVADEMKQVKKDKHIVLNNDKPLQVIDLPEKKKKTAWFERNLKITEEIKKKEAEMEKEMDKEASDSAKRPTGTSSPKDGERDDSSRRDTLRHKIREEMMMKLKTDDEIKTIDLKFKALNTPEPTKSTLLNDSKTGTVQGISTIETKLLPTSTPMTALRLDGTKILPTSTPVPTTYTKLDTINTKILPTATPTTYVREVIKVLPTSTPVPTATTTTKSDSTIIQNYEFSKLPTPTPTPYDIKLIR